MNKADAFLRALLVSNNATQAMQAAANEVLAQLACDVSWSGLIRGDYLLIGAHAGLRTPEMAAAWRLRVGEGIGGRAALEMRSYKSSDYQHDSRRVAGKRMIDNEGIAATLVAPIVVADHSIGVLYAAHRTGRVWRRDEVAKLEMISLDLAVRLKQLDVDGSSQAAAQRYQREAEVSTGALQKAAELTEVFAANSEIGSSLDAAASAVDVSIELFDAAGRCIASAGRGDEISAEVLLEQHLDEATGLKLVMRAGADGPSADDPALRSAVGALRLQLLRLSERERTAERLRGDLVEQLLTGRISDADGLAKRLALIGMSGLATGAQVLVIGSRGVSGERSPALPAGLVDSLQRAFAGCVLEQRGDRLVVLVDLAEGGSEEVRQRLVGLLRREGRGMEDIVIGVGRVCDSILDFSMSYDEASAACEVGLSKPAAAREGIVSARSIGIQGLASLPKAQLRTTVRDAFGPLILSDERKGTDLMATLRCYLGNDRHLPTTAEDLRVHYNTVRNRITRIEELLGVDLGDVDDRFRLETALRMEAVLQALSRRDEDAVTA